MHKKMIQLTPLFRIEKNVKPERHEHGPVDISLSATPSSAVPAVTVRCTVGFSCMDVGMSIKGDAEILLSPAPAGAESLASSRGLDSMGVVCSGGVGRRSSSRDTPKPEEERFCCASSWPALASNESIAGVCGMDSMWVLCSGGVGRRSSSRDTA